MATVHSSRLTALAALAALLVPAAAVAQDARLPSSNSRPASVSAGAVPLLDAYGRPLFAKNADDERAPASLVKLMTLYLANEDIERGKAELDEPVQISHYAALTPKYRMGLRAGEWVPLHVLLEGVAIASANDAATALAERLAGDESVFVERMNAKARELGLAGTRFTNPPGLPDPNPRSSRPTSPPTRVHGSPAAPGAPPPRGDADSRLRLRRVRHALRRPFGRRGGPRDHARPGGPLGDLAPEAARVHVAPRADGPLRGLLGRDRGGAAPRDPAAWPDRERRPAAAAHGRLPVARVLPRRARRARAPRGAAARDPLERLAPDARGRRRLERPRPLPPVRDLGGRRAHLPAGGRSRLARAA